MHTEIISKHKYGTFDGRGQTEIYLPYLKADTQIFLLWAPDRQISGVNSNCIDYEFVIASSKNTQEDVLPWDYGYDVGAAPKHP